MRVVIAPDSFKGTATAAEAAGALAKGLKRVWPDAHIDQIPIADGGEGTAEAMALAAGGRMAEVEVTGPLGSPVRASYAVIHSDRTAVIEMAVASGLHLVPETRRDPGNATTYGTGELARHALDEGHRTVIVGLGGSATTDGGAGFAQALGYSLKDAEGRELPRGGLSLAKLAGIDASGRHRALSDTRFVAACDVTNPLCGPNGAARIYGPQKGAGPALVEQLDAALEHFAKILERDLGVAVDNVPGAGAAGGFGGGVMAFANAELRSGFQIVSDALDLPARFNGADLVVTGEGRVDAQSPQGKAAFQVAGLAMRQGIPVAMVCGENVLSHEELARAGIATTISLTELAPTAAESMQNARYWLERAGEALGRKVDAVSG